ncbi:MAG TPA: N-acetyl-gamma-glutamyl-phosphate reductase, partial [Trueperaceae bacterium]|nr:N-acetyl-gamma-glutamyl-phosphate reductase [Trueperaceae bacterium]
MNTNLSKIKVGILGASGYAGAALIRRLLKHSLVDIVAIGSRQYESKAIATAWPQFAGLLDLKFVNNDE